MNLSNQDNNSSLERKQSSEEALIYFIMNSLSQNNIVIDVSPADEQNNSNSDVLPELEPADEQNNSNSDVLPELEPADEQNNSDSDVLPELEPADNNITRDNDSEENKNIYDDLPELINVYEPGECPRGEYCELKNALDNHLSRFQMRNVPSIYNHINRYHRQFSFDDTEQREIMRSYFNMLLSRELFRIMNSENNYEEKNNEPKCTFCNSYYDHHNHSQYFMACCAKDYCLKCVKDFKETEKKGCPNCHYSLKYLKDTELPNFDDVIPKDGEDCMICCYSMGTTQYNGKVTLECNCNLELCITCAYKSLKDTKHIKMENVQGLNGLVLPQEYIVKGSCPHCRQIPKNKDDIIALYNFLPPRY